MSSNEQSGILFCDMQDEQAFTSKISKLSTKSCAIESPPSVHCPTGMECMADKVELVAYTIFRNVSQDTAGIL
jgi:hypothetical protein